MGIKHSSNYFQKYIQQIEDSGLIKIETPIFSAQGIEILIDKNRKVLNFCSNNYLGLANNQDLINAAKEALDFYGFGMASVRFICGTQN